MVLSRMYEKQHSFFHSKENTKTISDKKNILKQGVRGKQSYFNYNKMSAMQLFKSHKLLKNQHQSAMNV